MSHYKIKQIHSDEYGIIRKLDRDAFEFNDRDSDGDFHEVFADNIRRSPYYIPELDLVAVTDDGLSYLGHAIFFPRCLWEIMANTSYGSTALQSNTETKTATLKNPTSTNAKE